MGSMQENLVKNLRLLGYSVTSRKLPYPTRRLVSSCQYFAEILDTYRRLGGINDTFPLNLRHWDLEADGIAIELDEVLHFNRYRSLTLQSKVYASLPHFPSVEYSQYCERYESECLRAGSYGRKWSTETAVSQFGIASAPGIINSFGSPRWKQRAFYDFVKDLMPLIAQVAVARISIWDRVHVQGREVLVKEILDNPDITAYSPVIELVKERASLQYPNNTK